MSNDEYRVVPSREGDRRVHFAGTEEDAKAFVAANFPRPHIEGGVFYGDEGPVPDVYVLSPNGDRHAYDGKEWSAHKDNKETATRKTAPKE